MITEARMLAAASAETLINGALRYDPASRQALAALAGKVLALDITEPELQLWVCFRDDGIGLTQHWEQAANCTLTGKLTDMLALARESRFNLAGSGVSVKGETSLLQQLKQITSQLDIDWEDALAGLIGDELAHPLASGLRRLHGYANRQLQQGRQQVEPWLSEELALVPTRPALDKFSREVSALAQATDRLQARLDSLIRSRGQ